MLTAKKVEANNLAWNIFGSTADTVEAVEDNALQERLLLAARKGSIKTKHNVFTGRLVAFAMDDGQLHVVVSGSASANDIAELKMKCAPAIHEPRISA